MRLEELPPESEEQTGGQTLNESAVMVVPLLRLVARAVTQGARKRKMNQKSINSVTKGAPGEKISDLSLRLAEIFLPNHLTDKRRKGRKKTDS